MVFDRLAYASCGGGMDSNEGVKGVWLPIG